MPICNQLIQFQFEMGSKILNVLSIQIYLSIPLIEFCSFGWLGPNHVVVRDARYLLTTQDFQREHTHREIICVFLKEKRMKDAKWEHAIHNGKDCVHYLRPEYQDIAYLR